MREPCELSAIIISYDGEQFLGDCLSTLIDELAGIKSEVLVVDNGSADRSIALIQDKFPQARLIANASNTGFAAAVNIGLSEARGEYLFILNQDLRFRSGSVRSLLARIRSDPRIGLIGPKFVGFDGRLQKCARAFPSYRHVLYEALFLSWLLPTHREFGSWRMGWFDHESERFVDQPMGSAMLMPRHVVDEVGTLDERFPIYFNDVDYCRRLHLVGYRCLYYPAAVVEHYVGGSARKWPVRMKARSMFSFYRYLRKYAVRKELSLLWGTGLIMLAALGPLLVATYLSSRKRSRVS